MMVSDIFMYRLLLLFILIVLIASHYLSYRWYKKTLCDESKANDNYITRMTKSYERYKDCLISSKNEVIERLEKTSYELGKLEEQLHALLIYTDCLIHPSPILYINKHRPDCGRLHQKGLEIYKAHRYKTKSVSSEEVAFINDCLNKTYINKEEDKKIKNRKASMEAKGYFIISVEENIDNTANVFGRTRLINRTIFKEKDTYWAVYHEFAWVVPDFTEAVQVELIKDYEGDKGFWYPVYKNT